MVATELGRGGSDGVAGRSVLQFFAGVHLRVGWSGRASPALVLINDGLLHKRPRGARHVRCLLVGLLAHLRAASNATDVDSIPLGLLA